MKAERVVYVAADCPGDAVTGTLRAQWRRTCGEAENDCFDGMKVYAVTLTAAECDDDKTEMREREKVVLKGFGDQDGVTVFAEEP